MTRRRSLPLFAIATIGVLLIAACGQKPGVSTSTPVVAGQELQLPEGTELDAEGNLVDSATGEVIATAEELAESNVDGSLTGSTTSSDTPSSTETSAETNAPNAPASGAGDTTGISENTIKIGVHAPITGAAPVPSDSANKGADIYWKWLEHNDERIFGRKVEVILKNDNYNPSQAVAVCREMVEQDKVFILSGIAGTDQIQACARYAASVGVPYISSGVTELGLGNLPGYFAVSMTYPDQQPLLAQLLKNRLGAGDETNGIVWFNTATFKDGHDAFLAAMKKEGLSVDYDRPVSKTAGASEAQAIAVDMAQAGIDNVNVLMSPVFFLQLMQGTRTQGYTPQWVAAGIQMTFDTVAAVGCRNGTIEGMKAFSPFPAWFDSNKYDPNFRKAIRAIYPEEGEGDDFEWLGWTSSKGLHGMFEALGPNPTRENLVATLQSGKTFFNEISPHLKYSPSNPFGAKEVHLSEARCSDAKWHTTDSWMSSF